MEEERWSQAAEAFDFVLFSPSFSRASEARMRFSFFLGSFGTVFRGTVVRHTKDGFAVRFVDMGDPQREVLRRSLCLSPSPSASL